MTTPELDKQAKIIKSGAAGHVQEFIDWCNEQGYALCLPRPDSLHGAYTPIMLSPEQIMADHFGIDRDKIETERRALLDHLRRSST